MVVFLLFLGSSLAVENIRFGDSILGGYPSSVVLIVIFIFKTHLHSHPHPHPQENLSIFFLLINI